MDANLRIARWIFLIAGVYGVVSLVPALFAEDMVSRMSPPALTHPEFYYGFFGSALVWQFMFLLISRDPARFRVLMPLAICEKIAFFVPCIVLYGLGRLEIGLAFLGGMIDGVLMAAFVWAWLSTRPANAA